MKVAVIGPSYPFRGGISHYTSLLCSALAERHEVRLLSLSRQYPKLLFPGKSQVDKSATAFKVDGALSVIDSIGPASWIRAAGLIRNWQPDTVIIQWWHPFFAPAFGSIASRCKRFSNVLFLCHNVMPHEAAGPTKVLTKYALRHGNGFIVHSAEDLINLKCMLPDALVRKSYHPTYEVFNQTPIDKSFARRKLGVPADGKVILFFGLIRKYKGLKYLLQAMPDVIKRTGAHLVVAGEFYEGKADYMSLIEKLGISEHVRVIDEYIPNEEVGTYFSAADVVALPYVTATQSGIVQIAYAFDRPVVTTNAGGLPEVVMDGNTGYVVPTQDHNALGNALIKFFSEDKARKFAENILAFREEFSWSRMVDTIESIAATGGRTKCSS